MSTMVSASTVISSVISIAQQAGAADFVVHCAREETLSNFAREPAYLDKTFLTIHTQSPQEMTRYYLQLGHGRLKKSF